MKTLAFTIFLLFAVIAATAQDETVFVYPNPAQDQMYVEIPQSLMGITTIRVRDMNGRVVYRDERSLDAAGDRKTLIEINNLSNGAYLLEVSDANHAVTTQFIKN